MQENALTQPAKSRPLQSQPEFPAVYLFRKRLGKLCKYLGPAFIVSVAYIDPGNFATNISGGSIFNYSLLWVILWSNLMAIFLQTLSAKLGIASGENLTSLCARTFTRRTNWVLWSVAVLAAMATDLAEFLGSTLGLCLLLGIPVSAAAALSGVLVFLIVYLERYGQRVVETVITLLVAVIGLTYVLEVFLAKPNWTAVGIHTLLPSLPNGQAVLIAAGMLGATVMHHVIYLHSQLVQCRNTKESPEEKLKHFRMERIDIILAMNIAFLINAAMVIVSAAVFYRNGLVVDTISEAHYSLAPLLGSLSSGAFGLALLASGLSSSAVGTMAGQTILQGFVKLNLNLHLRRLITMGPALLIIILGINPMKALVLSQVFLSFALPSAIIPLLILTAKKELMGSLANRPLTNAAGWIIVSLIIALNMALLVLTFLGNV